MGAMRSNETTSENETAKAKLARRNDPPPPGCPQNAVLYPKDHYNTGAIRELLDKNQHKYTEVRSEKAGWTAFIRVALLDDATKKALEDQDSMGLKDQTDPARKKFNVWRGKTSDSRVGKDYKYHFDDEATTDSFVYVVGEDGYWKNHEEFTGQTALTVLRAWPEAGAHVMDSKPDDARFSHGSSVAAMVSGPKLGICRNCQVRFSAVNYWQPGDPGEKWARRIEVWLAHLVAVLDEIKDKGREGRAVVSISWQTSETSGPAGSIETFYDLLKLLDDTGTVIVIAAGNSGIVPSKYPAVWGNPAHNKGEHNKHIPNLVIVGATDQATYKSSFSNYADWITTFAPGEDIHVPWHDPLANADPYTTDDGTSLGE
ncbi:hypothetical protein ACHAQA_010002 [Verticillium albo-atrum]